ncbi:DNA polymerase III subunit delta [Patescibacteria group bacterium]|nr:MAG: DNA polymerase III subunit delta [Patescibacteria group bacterium]
MILFFYGSNSYEARQQLAKLVAQYESKTGSNLGIERIDGRTVTMAQLRASLQAVPFLAASRLAIIEGVGGNKSVAPKVPELLDDIPSTTVAVFYEPSLDKRTSYTKVMQAQATKSVEFKPLATAQLHRWVSQRVEQLGATISRPALGKLLEIVGDDQWRLDNELTKLSQYNPAITVESVESMVESSPDDNVFALIEAVTAGRLSQALEGYHTLRADGHNQLYILSMITWQLRNLLLAKSAGRVTAPQLAKQAGMSPYVAEKMLARRHLFSDQQLKQAFLLTVETEYRIKTGDGLPDALIERLITDVAALMKQVSQSAAKPARSR